MGPEMVLLAVPAEMFAEGVEDAVKHMLRVGKLNEMIETQIHQYLDSRIKAMVAEEIEDSDRFKEIRAEVYQQLVRWPAVKNDPMIKAAISKAILDCFVKVI
jgi:hypothetical protein